MLPCLSARLVSPTVTLLTSTRCPFKRLLYNDNHFLVGLPKALVLFKSGIILLLTSLSKVTVSKSLLPRIKSPPNVTLPVECKFPVIFQLLRIFNSPKPSGLISILVSAVVVLIVLKSIFKSSVAIAVANISVAAFKFISPERLLILLVPISNDETFAYVPIKLIVLI